MISFLLLATLWTQDTVRYEFTIESVRAMLPTRAGTANAPDSLRVRGELTVVLADTLGGRVAHLLIDRVIVEGDSPARPPQLRGNRYTTYLPRDGAPKILPVGSDPLREMQGLPIIAALFPAIHTGRAINDRWVDTTDVDHVVAGVRASGTRITDWFLLDRRDETLLASGRFEAKSTAALDPSNTIAMSQRGRVRAVVRPGWPADVSQVIDSATVHLTLSGTVLTIRQETTITLARRDFRAASRPGLRRRVPG